MFKLFHYFRILLFSSCFLIMWYIILIQLSKYLHPKATLKHYRKENTNRLNFSKEFLRNYKYKPPNNVRVVIAIVTVNRDFHGDVNLDYASQVIGSFLYMLHKEQVPDVGMFLCNASSLPHYELSYVEKVIGRKNTARYLNPMTALMVQKETKDYFKCLVEVRNRYPSVEYLVMNEDDGLPLHGFLDDVQQIIKQLESRSKRLHNNNISHVKLHHPLRLRKLPYLIFMFAVPILFSSSLKLFSQTKNKEVSIFTYLLIFAVIIPLFYTLGANNVGLLHHKVLLGYVPLVLPESCCTVSVLFSGGQSLNKTIDYLHRSSRAREHVGKDTLLDELPKYTGMDVLMTEFNLVKHIGMHSTLRHYPLAVEVIAK